MLQVVNHGYFAGGMTRQCQFQLAGRDTTAVIDDPDKLQSTIHQVNANLRSSRVDTILNQFFDHRGRSLDHLSRGYFCRDIRCKLAYWHSVGSPKRKTGSVL